MGFNLFCLSLSLSLSLLSFFINTGISGIPRFPRSQRRERSKGRVREKRTCQFFLALSISILTFEVIVACLLYIPTEQLCGCVSRPSAFHFEVLACPLLRVLDQYWIGPMETGFIVSLVRIQKTQEKDETKDIKTVVFLLHYHPHIRALKITTKAIYHIVQDSVSLPSLVNRKPTHSHNPFLCWFDVQQGNTASYCSEIVEICLII